MKKIGITGGIGSGKSTVCEAFKLFNVPVYNADNRAKYLINNDVGVKKAIVKLLGEAAYSTDGSYNKTYVASQVFKFPDLLSALNGIVHPEVRRDAETWFLENKLAAYIIYEAAIMNAAKEENDLDFVIVVAAPQTTRMKRILRRDTFRSSDDVERIFENQRSDEDFLNIADFVIKNDEEDLVLEQVIQLNEQFNAIL